MPEQFANNIRTTLNGAINNSTTSVVVTSATGMPTTGNFRLLVAAEGANTDEIMTVTSRSGTTCTVIRASEPTGGVQSASAHASGATVTVVLTADGLLQGIWNPDMVQRVYGTPTTAFEFDTSSLSGLTALSPTPDVVNANTTVPGHYFIQDNAASLSMVGHYIAATPPFTSMCKVTDMSLRDDYNSAGLFVGVATPGKMSMARVGGLARQLFVLTMANPTDAGASNSFGPLFGQIATPAYFAIVAHTNTNVDYAWSANGITWARLHLGFDPSMTIGSTGFGMFSFNSTYGLSVAFDWFRVWNSALTLYGLA